MTEATIRISRGRELFGIWRRLSVYLDGNLAGKIGWNGTLELTVPPGTHSISVSMDWCSSVTLFEPLNERSIVDIYVTLPPGFFARSILMYSNAHEFFGLKKTQH